MSDINDVQPTSLKHLESKSQNAMLEMVRLSLDVCFQDGVRFPHSSLVGAPGLGKSALAQTIASELCVPYKEVLGQTIRTPADLNALLLGATDKSIVFVDESDTLPVPIMTALFLALDKRTLFLSSSGSVQSLPLADFTLLLATTEEYGMLQPLRDRMRLTLRFQFYCEEDLQRMVLMRAKSLGWEIEEGCVAYISHRSRGTPRIAFNILQSAHFVSRSEGSDTITFAHLHKACQLAGLDERGLNMATDVKYLSLLRDGEKPLNVLASHLGLPSRTLTMVIEPYILRAGFMEKGTQSKRFLTAKGREHLLRYHSHE
jgi:holliday junction DNA helicase RuvB